MAAVVVIKLEASERFARWRDWYRGTGKTCLGGGMHCPSACSYCWKDYDLLLVTGWRRKRNVAVFSVTCFIYVCAIM